MAETLHSGDFSTPLGAPSVEQLTSLVFELALQLHQERMRRIALEVALEAGALLSPQIAESLHSDPIVQERGAIALEKAMSGIMRVLTENADPSTPLRPMDMPSAKRKPATEL